MNFADVILPLNLSQAFTYEIPESFEGTKPGMRCLVPVGNKKYVGCILKIHTTRPTFKTKGISHILDDEPLLTPRQLDLMQWASAYYLTPLGEVFRHFLPASLTETKERKIKRTVRPVTLPESFSHVPVELNDAQEKAVAAILKATEPVFIHGITGSGKTEIYRSLAQASLEQGRQVLILVPEIGLTPQTIGRFASLGADVGVYHSRLTPAQRAKVWTDVREGRLSLVIATRSGIFLPFQNLGLIVIDEEHDGSYKQDERFCYHARDLALWRGEREKIRIVLGSATPSLEMVHRIQTGKMVKIAMRERATGSELPRIETIDLRQTGKSESSIFSPRLLDALDRNLKDKNQSLVFFNRRGFAPFVICRTCGDVPLCAQCDISLTLHKSKNAQGNMETSLVCHYCDAVHPYVPLCQSCGKDTKHYTGYGTERLEEELRKYFPSARLGRLDRDSAKGQAWIATLEKMKRGEIDILIGTQMVTKGHDYPHLTLVGIVDADAALHLPDFRAAERTFQMVTQVSGRAGRHEKAGTVLIQSYFPDHPSLEFAIRHDDEGFYRRELEERREAGYPPFCRMIEVRLTGKKQMEVIRKIQSLAERIAKAIPASAAALLGPGPSLIEKVREQYRWRLLLKTASYLKIQPALRRTLDDFRENHLSSALRLLVNVDPVDML